MISSRPRALGSFGQLGARTSGGIRYRDFNAGDGYVYRQYDNGDILIVQSPRGGAGTLVTRETHPEPWQAITTQINAIKRGRLTAGIKTGAQIATDMINATRPQQPKKKQRKKKRKGERTSSEFPTAPASSEEIPWLPIGLGVGVLLLVAAFTRQ